MDARIRQAVVSQISAGFGSLLACVLDLSPEDRRIAVSVGIGTRAAGGQSLRVFPRAW